MSTLADVWSTERLSLTGLAYRILGSWQDAEDVAAVAGQRLTEQEDVANPAGWLRTVVVRLAIDEARSAHSRRVSYVGPWLPEPVATDRLPEEVAESRALLGLGMLRVLQELDPVERAVFVLREAFDVPYAEIAECVDRSAATCRQIVSRARKRLPLVRESEQDVDRRLLTALVAAIADGDPEAVVRLVSDGCVVWNDSNGATAAARRPILGADNVARFLLGVTRINPPTGGPHWVDVNGRPALLMSYGDGDRLSILEHDGTVITGIQVHSNPEKLRQAVTKA